MPKMLSHSHPNPLLLLLLLFLSLVLFSSTLAEPDLSDDRAALLALRSSLGGKTLRWDPNATTPCVWPGVACHGGRVTTLRLPAGDLRGSIPSGVFPSLTQLRVLSLRINSVQGPLPDDLGQCAELRQLFLQDNQFSGEVPEFLFGLRNLVSLDLAGNGFSGELSGGFNNLTRLSTLRLERNRFSGSLPELNLPNLVRFNVSFNRLNGSIPSKLAAMEAGVFEGNLLCGGPMGPCPGESNTTTTTSIDDFKKKKLTGGAIAAIAIGLVVFLLIVLILIVLCRNRSSISRKTGSVDSTLEKHSSAEMEKPLGCGNGRDRNLDGGYSGTPLPVPKVEMSNVGKRKLVFSANATRFFQLEDLLKASAEVLGKGTFGTTYKAILEAGRAMAVKRLKDVVIPEKEFREMVETIGFMDHKNLVPLRAYYYSREEKLLVYDYLDNGSLSALLHGNRGTGRTPLNWETRSGIALGAARGIEYLHAQGPAVSHGNIKSSNVLLTKDYDGLVCDFGLAQLVAPTSTPNRVAGYRAPEVTDICRVSQKADVYSFGVLLLELLTGRAPTHAILNEEGVDLPRWVQSVVQEDWTAEVFDLELLRYDSIEDELVQLLRLALDCTSQHPDKRPTMMEVVHRIEDICRNRISLAQDLDGGYPNDLLL